AHGRGGDDGRLLHPRRPDLQRARHLAGVRHPGVDAAHARGDSRPLLRGVPQSPRVDPGQWRRRWPVSGHFRPSSSRSSTSRLKEQTMTSWQVTRIIAGIFVLFSLALGAPRSPLFHSQWWLLLTAFVGINLLQSGVTRWCPAEFVVRKLGARSE